MQCLGRDIHAAQAPHPFLPLLLLLDFRSDVSRLGPERVMLPLLLLLKRERELLFGRPKEAENKTHFFLLPSSRKNKRKTRKKLKRQYPITQAIVAPLAPLAQLYYSVPFASLVLFFAIYLGLVQQTDRWSRFVRFNAMQAILLDILLIIPGVIESVFKAPGGGAGLQIYMTLYNTVWLFCLASFVAGVFGALILGKTTRLPLVAEAADQQVRF